MKPGGLECRTVGDVPLEDGRTLRIGIYARDSQREEVVIASGTGAGREWREDPAEGLTIPHEALPELVRGLLKALEE